MFQYRPIPNMAILPNNVTKTNLYGNVEGEGVNVPVPPHTKHGYHNPAAHHTERQEVSKIHSLSNMTTANMKNRSLE